MDTINYGFPCVPIDGRASGGYNEVFIGAPTWYARVVCACVTPLTCAPNRPNIVPECVYYECGTVPGEAGHCIQRTKPGQRSVQCSNSDNNLCSVYAPPNGSRPGH